MIKSDFHPLATLEMFMYHFDILIDTGITCIGTYVC